ncbi:MAG: 16S rRNA (adenine(1518)-N(6)/adenine(1519)-N(6))-dimethyltransferase RsmA [Ferrovibrio sp.]|uniref:16S rRNA (adenine(1518)-N(6)/adenine(1519)-N(6))- dimethyltransferase RsmA n=1 Tax=Ferrovibrio sp. TaxID=1917215 RepID=UPI0026094A0F|nr:16S rRNA (adenine(1518)-N(6)/adenine(1519)-N(6))-dimethyltransferase RsmA [Ferrovibrio sp.]MCW0235185.1 16S rRNA (adenine(1518)-N(6)/adenine(1519)-N(6))-dimethyltransferase RsmA [Ferrovibrio sp.]
MSATPSNVLEALPPLREVIARHELAARKALGQNFLLDLNLTRKIARAAMPWTGAPVIEIGPGPGGLTRALLLEGAPKVIAIERDERCLAALQDVVQAAAGRLTLQAGDALDTDFATLAPPPWQVVANLPYNIATPLLLGWLAQPQNFTRITVLVQKEVAERMAAKPGGKTYGRLAVASQWRASVRLLFDIGPQAFVPAPKVTSTLVELTPRPAVAEAEPAKLERVTAAAFNQRRKMLRAALRPLWPDADAKLAQAGIDPTRRAETLSIEEFCALARLL